MLWPIVVGLWSSPIRTPTAIAVTASLLTALARADRAPALSRVVITEAHTVPLLRPLLIAAGIGEFDSWNAAVVVGIGLDRIAHGADAVIDMIGRPPAALAVDRRPSAPMGRSEPFIHHE